METVTNAANTAVTTASKLIFGETTTQQSGTEPKAGETGNQAQPYDAGNIEPGNPGQTVTASTTSSDPLSKDTSTNDGINQSRDTAATSSDNASAPRDTTTSALDNLGGVNNPGAATEQKSSTSENVGGVGAVDSSVSADPKSGQKLDQKQQGADRPAEKPSGEGADAVKDTKDEGEAALAKKDPNDHSGEPMKMHGLDDSKDKARVGSTAGQEGGGEHGKEQGTGELHVKSTGLQADGGDFDATKPGAGREADRLLEQKGIRRDDPSKGPPSPEMSSKSPERSDKVSKLDKIKEKLHIGKKDKS